MENDTKIYAWYKRHGGKKGPDQSLEEQLKTQDELAAVRDRLEDVLGELEDGGFDFDAVLVTLGHVFHLMVKSATDKDVSIILHKDAKDDLHIVPVSPGIIHSLIGDVLTAKQEMVEKMLRNDGTTSHNPL